MSLSQDILLSPRLSKKVPAILKDKSVRLGIPLYLGLLCWAPLAAFIAYLPGDPSNYFAYWFLRFFRPTSSASITSGFIGVLLLFFLVLGLIFLIVGNKISSIKNQNQESLHSFFRGIHSNNNGNVFRGHLFYPAEAFTNGMSPIPNRDIPYLCGLFRIRHLRIHKNW